MSQNPSNTTNRAKLYQLVLFPMNNGATKVYYILTLNFIAYYASGVLGLVVAFAGLIFLAVLDNSFARLTPNWMLRFMWTVPLSMALANLIWLWVK